METTETTKSVRADRLFSPFDFDILAAMLMVAVCRAVPSMATLQFDQARAEGLAVLWGFALGHWACFGMLVKSYALERGLLLRLQQRIDRLEKLRDRLFGPVEERRKGGSDTKTPDFLASIARLGAVVLILQGSMTIGELMCRFLVPDSRSWVPASASGWFPMAWASLALVAIAMMLPLRLTRLHLWVRVYRLEQYLIDVALKQAAESESPKAQNPSESIDRKIESLVAREAELHRGLEPPWHFN